MWRCGGLRWGVEGPGFVWEGPRGSVVRPLVYGSDVGFRVVGERACVGARGNGCPVGAVVPGRRTQARCGECARLDRLHSVAADGAVDDPRVYRVYLAWFGCGLVKVGITREERGSARLMEQGAVAFSWVGRGPLMAARRSEEVLRAALGVPDRVPYAVKRGVRARLPGVEERAGEVAALHARAVGVVGWPDSLERVACDVVDHGRVFGLEGLPEARGVVSELVDGGVVGGRLVAAAGPDLHLEGAGGGVVVVDTRLMGGWGFEAAQGVGEVSVPVRSVVVPGVQDGLF